jgi:hypothetical protein
MRKVVGIAAVLWAGTAFAQALTPEQQDLVAGCQKYAMQVYSVSHFGEPSITQKLNSTFATFKADNATIACEYLTNPNNGHRLFNNIFAAGVPRVRLKLGDNAGYVALREQFLAYYTAQGLELGQIKQLAGEWLDSLQVHNMQTEVSP